MEKTEEGRLVTAEYTDAKGNVRTLTGNREMWRALMFETLAHGEDVRMGAYLPGVEGESKIIDFFKKNFPDG